MDAPERPNDSESEGWVLRPSLKKIIIDLGPSYIRTHALKRVECGRMSGTKSRSTVLSEFVVSNGTESIHHSIGMCGRRVGDLQYRLNTIDRRKKNIEEIGIGELRDGRECDILGGSGRGRNRHSNSRHRVRDSSKE